MASLVACLAYYAILSPRPSCACKQLRCLQQPLVLGIFIGLGLQAVFIQIVTYGSLDVLQRCFRGHCQSISDFLGVFFLIKFFDIISLVNLWRWDSDIKGYLYRYIVCGQCLCVFQFIELQPVYKHFLYKCKVNYALLGSSFLGGFTS